MARYDEIVLIIKFYLHSQHDIEASGTSRFGITCNLHHWLKGLYIILPALYSIIMLCVASYVTSKEVW